MGTVRSTDIQWRVLRLGEYLIHTETDGNDNTEGLSVKKWTIIDAIQTIKYRFN